MAGRSSKCMCGRSWVLCFACWFCFRVTNKVPNFTLLVDIGNIIMLSSILLILFQSTAPRNFIVIVLIKNKLLWGSSNWKKLPRNINYHNSSNSNVKTNHKSNEPFIKLSQSNVNFFTIFLTKLIILPTL